MVDGKYCCKMNIVAILFLVASALMPGCQPSPEVENQLELNDVDTVRFPSEVGNTIESTPRFTTEENKLRSAKNYRPATTSQLDEKVTSCFYKLVSSVAFQNRENLQLALLKHGRYSSKLENGLDWHSLKDKTIYEEFESCCRDVLAGNKLRPTGIAVGNEALLLLEEKNAGNGEKQAANKNSPKAKQTSFNEIYQSMLSHRKNKKPLKIWLAERLKRKALLGMAVNGRKRIPPGIWKNKWVGTVLHKSQYHPNSMPFKSEELRRRSLQNINNRFPSLSFYRAIEVVPFRRLGKSVNKNLYPRRFSKSPGEERPHSGRFGKSVDEESPSFGRFGKSVDEDFAPGFGKSFDEDFAPRFGKSVDEDFAPRFGKSVDEDFAPRFGKSIDEYFAPRFGKSVDEDFAPRFGKSVDEDFKPDRFGKSVDEEILPSELSGYDNSAGEQPSARGTGNHLAEELLVKANDLDGRTDEESSTIGHHVNNKFDPKRLDAVLLNMFPLEAE